MRKKLRKQDSRAMEVAEKAKEVAGKRSSASSTPGRKKKRKVEEVKKKRKVEEVTKGEEVHFMEERRSVFDKVRYISINVGIAISLDMNPQLKLDTPKFLWGIFGRFV